MSAVTWRCMMASAMNRPYAVPTPWSQGRRSGLRYQAELAHEAELVQPSPALADAAVADPEDVDPRQGRGPARGGHAEELTLLRAAGGEQLNHQVAFGDEEAEVTVPVRERGPEHGRGLAHAFPAGGAAHRRVVV